MRVFGRLIVSLPGHHVADKGVYHFGRWAIFFDKSSELRLSMHVLSCVPDEQTDVCVSGCVDADARSRCSNAHLCE